MVGLGVGAGPGPGAGWSGVRVTLQVGVRVEGRAWEGKVRIVALLWRAGRRKTGWQAACTSSRSPEMRRGWAAGRGLGAWGVGVGDVRRVLYSGEDLVGRGE